MVTLIIDTSGAVCSVALVADGKAIAAAAETVGRGHAERLMPMIATLPGGGRADDILVGCGPGSFTGVRVGVAAARGLGLGWSVPVAGYSATALLAARARHDYPGVMQVATVINGGHGELFVELFDGTASVSALASLAPAAAMAAVGAHAIAGSGAAALAALGAPGPLLAVEPVAADARLLGPLETALAPRPIYGRAPDARLPG